MTNPTYAGFVANRPVYRIGAAVYKSGNETWRNENIKEEPDIALDENGNYFAVGKNSISVMSDGGSVFGNAISHVANLTLVKSNEYTAADFVGASLQVYVKAYETNKSTWTFIPFGKMFFVSEVTQENGLIKIVAQDAMTKCDKPYVWGLGNENEWFSLKDIYHDVLQQVWEVSLPNDYEFFNSDFLVRAKPVGYTCRQMLGFIAQIACGNAVVSSEWVTVTEAGDKLPKIEIHTLKNASTDAPFNALTQWISIEDGGEGIAITGLSCVMTMDYKGNKIDPPIEYKSPTYSNNYAVALNNPLIAGTEVPAFMEMMSTVFSWRFHKFKGKHIGYPLAEYGDSAAVVHSGGAFHTFLTNITWNIDGATEFECDIASSADNAADYDDSNGTIEKTESGIQRADLAEDVQASLERADDCRTAEEQNTIDEAIKDRVSTVEEKLGGNGTVGFANVTTNSLKMTGEVEIYGSTPHLDFHFGNSSSDYTTRIIETASGKLNIAAPNGVLINGKNADVEAVALTVYGDRLTNLNYTAKYSELMGAVFVRIYGTINYNMNAGSDYNVLSISSRKPNYIAALACDCAKNCVATARTDSDGNGVIRIRPHDSNINGNAVYITGFWFV